jgi:hypothetical protein
VHHSDRGQGTHFEKKRLTPTIVKVLVHTRCTYFGCSVHEGKYLKYFFENEKDLGRNKNLGFGPNQVSNNFHTLAIY